MHENSVAKRNWIPILGRWRVADGSVKYQSDVSLGDPPKYGICLTSDDLTDGKVSAMIRVSQGAEARFVFGFRALDESYLMAGLRGWGKAYTIGEYKPGTGWTMLAGVGSESDLSEDRSYQVEVEIIGQRVKLTAEGVRVLDHQLKEPPSGGQLGLFAWDRGGEAEFSDISILPHQGTVFVVMEFSDPYQQLYEEVIVPVAQEAGLRAYHGGEVLKPGMIVRDIEQGIVEAKVVVAEITPTNQNVFYEVGFSHALNKPTILLADRSKQLPFDIGGYRVLFYDNTIAGKKQVEEGLRKHLSAILRK